MSHLTPEQAADVIRYYHAGMSPEQPTLDPRNKVAIARAAIFAGRPEETILPQEKPTDEKIPVLEFEEMVGGMQHLLG